MTRPLIPAAKPLFGEEERAAVDEVLRSGMVAQGPQVAAFEEEFSAQLLAGRRCQAVSSGTAGLHVGLLACGGGPGGAGLGARAAVAGRPRARGDAAEGRAPAPPPGRRAQPG